jgi:putative ABC transport system substrate-binding protein
MKLLCGRNRGSGSQGPGLRFASPRPFLLLAFVAAATLQVPPGWAQQPKVPVVGMLISHAAANDPVFDNFRAGLREYGYEDGRNIRLKIVTAEGQLDRLPGLAQELVRQNVDVIIAPHEVSAQAALTATTTIPIVLAGFGADPVALGLIDSVRRPGGNITGIYALVSGLDGKRLEILKEAVPDVSRVAVLWDPAFSRSQLGEVQSSSKSLGVRLELIEIRKPQDLEGAFKTAKHKKVGAVMLLASPIFYTHRTKVAALAFGARLPSISPYNYATAAGNLMSYGTDTSGNWRRAAYYVDRLLKGAKPSDLPVEQVSKPKLTVNLKTAKALGITIPESILLRADEVIR